MKLPFDLGLKLFFRLLLPGFLITLGLLPAIYTLWNLAQWQVSGEYTLVLGTLLTGSFMTALDMPIYMLFEGRRFWADRFRNWFIARERKQLERLKIRLAKFRNADRQKYLETSVEIRKFPINASGDYEAQFPTRLGNLLAAYETYPDTRYGMDGIFYWYRIWLTLDKDTKEEIDNRSAFADGSVYTSFAAMLAGSLWLLYGMLTLFSIQAVQYLPRPSIALLLALLFIAIGYATYRLSVFIHSQFGEVFKSVFDVHASRVDVSCVVSEIAHLTKDPLLEKSSRREQLDVAWRYLHNFRVKCKSCERSLAPLNLKSHVCGK